MNRHTIRVLEFEKIRSRLREHCLTAEADVDLRNERISSDRDTVRQHIETAKAVRLCLESTTEFPTLSFPALRDILAVLEKEGSLLDAPDIGAVGAYSRSSVALRQYLERAGKMTDSAQIGELVESVPDLSPVADRIFRLVDPDL